MTVKATISASATAGVTFSNDVYLSLANTTLIFNATENNVQNIFQTAGTLSLLSVYVQQNAGTGTTTIQSFKNGAAGNISISVGSGLTGIFTDSVNSDTISAGDTMSLFVDRPTGNASSMVITFVAVEFDSTSQTTKIACMGSGALALANTTRYMKLEGSLALLSSITSTDLFQVDASVTNKNFSINITANPRTSTTSFFTQKNGSTANQAISVPSGLTGWFSDTVNTDSLVAGDTYNYGITCGAGSGTITWASISTEQSGSTAVHLDGYNTSANSTVGDRILNPFGGNANSDSTTNEVRHQTPINHAGSLSNFRMQVPTNSLTGTATFTLRKNGTDTTVSFTVSAGSTGNFVSTNSVSYVAGDLFSIKCNIATGSTGSINPSWYSIVDTQQSGTVYNDSISASVTAGDSMAAAATFTTTTSDSVTAGDSLTVVATFNATISNGVTVADSEAAVATFNPSLSESVTSGDSLSNTMTMGASTSDSITLQDALNSQAVFAVALAETVTASDSFTQSLVLNLSVSENVHVDDSLTAAAVFNATIGEIVNALDSATNGNVYANALTESVSLGDTMVATVDYRVTISAAVTVSDIVGAMNVMTASLSETLSLMDGLNQRVVFNAVVAEDVDLASTFNTRSPKTTVDVRLTCYITDHVRLDAQIVSKVALRQNIGGNEDG